MYFDARNSRSKVLDRQVNWGDNVYNIGANVTSENEFMVGALGYEYAFMRAPTYEVAASIGLHVTEFTLKLSGDATVNGVPTSKAVQSNSVTAHLPVIGLRGAWVVTPNILLEAQGQFFKIKVDEVDGNWTDFQAKATWMFDKTSAWAWATTVTPTASTWRRPTSTATSRWAIRACNCSEWCRSDSAAGRFFRPGEFITDNARRLGGAAASRPLSCVLSPS